jgi:hypothetical protein
MSMLHVLMHVLAMCSCFISMLHAFAMETTERKRIATKKWKHNEAKKPKIRFVFLLKTGETKAKRIPFGPQ